jgi:hypothetical protein
VSLDTIVETLRAVIADKNQSALERERAAVALKFYSDKIAEELNPSGSVERDKNDRWVIEAFAKMGAKSLWDDPDDCMITTWVDDGIARKAVSSRTYHDPSYEFYGKPRHMRGAEITPIPKQVMPQPVPSVHSTPVLLPTPIPPSPEEKRACELVASKFTPEKVEERVAAIRAAEQSKPLSAVAEVEQEMQERSDLQRRIEENERELSRLRALRDSQTA